MKKKLFTNLAFAMLLVLSLFTSCQSAAAAPTGEIVIVQSTIGREIPIPWEELIQANDWMKLLYDPLIGTTANAELSTEMGLARKWEMSPDGLTWTFYIRKGVKFHDGMELTAKDVKFTIEMDLAPGSKVSDIESLRKTIKSMEIKDPYTLVINCKIPSLFLPHGFLSDIGANAGLILPKEYYEKVGRDNFYKKPIGTGPYKFHSQVTGTHFKMEATDKHWRDGVPRYKYVTFRIIPEESSRIAMLKTGSADIARISRESVKECQDSGLNVIAKKNAAIVQFRPVSPFDFPPLTDIRLRKALNLAIDREAIIKNIFNGLANPTTTFPGAGNIMGIKGAPTLKPYPYDPEKAMQLIKEAGFEGLELMIPNMERAGVPEMSRVVEAASGYWRKVGLNPKIYNIAYTQFRSMRQAKKVTGHLQPDDDATCRAMSEIVRVVRDNLHSTGDTPAVKDPKVDQMLDRANSSLNREEVEKIMVDLYRYMYDNYVFIPICDIDETIATTQRIPNWNPGDRRRDRNYNEIIRQP